jgi:MraZ protein
MPYRLGNQARQPVNNGKGKGRGCGRGTETSRKRQEGMAVFRGNHPAKVDPKGRLKMPAAFKLLVDAQYVVQFYVTSTDGESAQIWPLPEWEKQEALLAESSTMDAAVEKYLNLTSYYGQQVEMDSEGRILLPQILRGKAKLDAEVAVLGKLHYLEVHNLEVFEQRLQANALTAEDRQSLAAILRRHSGQ